ncbi:unnamed protein product [Cylicocyclus nassatus]|uniref:Uncharacterized protein n=1 Tax=Cylicocyclus nassatus TaxID=53992 RepID=A0AA36DQI2_CYLNA|nr:unnamed protein product [Cylicocyclus nassatus]
MHHVTEHSEYIDDYSRQPIPFARSEYLLYNVNDEHGRYGSIVEQQGVIENQSSMLVKQHYPKILRAFPSEFEAFQCFPFCKESTNVPNEVDDVCVGSWVTITFISQSTAQLPTPPLSPEPETPPPIEAVIDLPPPTPEVSLPPPVHPLYVTDKSVIVY